MTDHIKLTDVVTPEGDRHLLGCEECQAAFPTAYWFARSADDGPDCA